MENYSFKELYDIKIKSIFPMDVGDRHFEEGEVLLAFDKIDIANITEKTQEKTAKGGYDARSFINWEEKQEIDSNKEIKVIDAIKAYLESNDCYPNYIFNSYKVENYLFNEIVKKAKEENKTDVLALLRTYSKTVDERELEFKNLCLDVFNGVNSEKFNILDFYRLTHMPVKKFMLFMRVAAYRRLVGGSIVEKINEFTEKELA